MKLWMCYTCHILLDFLCKKYEIAITFIYFYEYPETWTMTQLMIINAMH